MKSSKPRRSGATTSTVGFPTTCSPAPKAGSTAAGGLWIEATSIWPKDAPGYGEGRWYVRIGNVERQSDELTELEEPLHDYATSENLLP